MTFLNDIYQSLDNPERSQLIWLHGMAGVGKSAVAFSVAERMRGLKVTEQTKTETRLAGTFFFSRKKPNRSTTGYFFATLAYQLACNFPSVREDLNRAIHDNPALLDPNKSLRDQMEGLFLRPLRGLQFRLRNCLPSTFVIDALDECVSKPELTDLISLLDQALREPNLPVIHILLTSRSETHICNVIQKTEVRSLASKIPAGISGEGMGTVIISLDGAVDVDKDIHRFLEHSFIELESHPGFPQPTTDELAQLASRAGRRFIVAFTMMKFIEHGYQDPRDRLQVMLRFTSELLPGKEVYELYNRILATCANPVRAYLHLSVVAALADPLPIRQISELLGPGEGKDVEKTLVQLRSVIDIPTDSSLPVNIYHSSVRDYVSDPSNCNLIEVQRIKHSHSILACSSFRLMMREIPLSMAFQNVLLELNKQSKAMRPHDPKTLKRSLAFIVEPPEPLHALIGLLWTRGYRRSALQSWTMSRDGLAWLQSLGGNDWLRTQEGKDWLKTEWGQDWLQTRWGNDWLRSYGGEDWLQTQWGKEWLQTQSGEYWLQTLGGKLWLQTKSGHDWLHTRNAQGSLQSHKQDCSLTHEQELLLTLEQEWLQTKPLQGQSVEDWLQTLERNWLQSLERDWLQHTQEGREWLWNEREDWLHQWAKDWLKTQGGKDWLRTQDGQYWLQTQDGQDWLCSHGGREWLQTHTERDQLQITSDWSQTELHTESLQEWLQTQDGQRWLQTESVVDWLQTFEVQEWLQTHSGQGWLQTRSGQQWLQTESGENWLQTSKGEEWLRTHHGRGWLQTESGRDWLQTQSGQNWLQTPDGRTWQTTLAASVWLTIEEFCITFEAINEHTIDPEIHLLPAFQVIQQFKSLPDFLMFPAFLALRHQSHSSPALLLPPVLCLPDTDIIHAMKAFVNFAKEARERSQSASDALKYACQNWAFHLSRVNVHLWNDELNCKFNLFWSRHLLSWLERQWCLKGLLSCLLILAEGQKHAKVCGYIDSYKLRI